MIKWMKAPDTVFHAVSLVTGDEDDRRLHTNRRVQKGAVLINVPSRFILRESTAWSLPVAELLLGTSSHTILALYLLEEKHKGVESYFFPLINMLPSSYDKMPLFAFDVDDKKYAVMQGSMIQDSLSRKRAALRKEYKELVRRIPAYMKRITLQHFCWARTAVITRAFSRVSVGTDTPDELCLVPVADMVNTSTEPNLSWAFTEEGGFSMVTTRDIPRGLQCLDSYGLKDNNRLFMNYGFVLPINQIHNQVDIYFDIPRNYAPLQNLYGPRDRSTTAIVGTTHRTQKSTTSVFGCLSCMVTRRKSLPLSSPR